MELEHVDEVELHDALRGEVELQRVKRYYYERNYKYEYSVTPEHADVARRAATWQAVYFWRRGLYKVQYAGMSEEAMRASIDARASGYAGGMPPGAQISEEEAIDRWIAGERAYMRMADPLKRVGERNPYDLSNEPMFVRLDAEMRLTTREMHTEEAGAVYRELSDEMGAKPHSGGVNCGRRNSAVAVSQGLDSQGMGCCTHPRPHLSRTLRLLSVQYRLPTIIIYIYPYILYVCRDVCAKALSCTPAFCGVCVARALRGPQGAAY